MPTKWKQNFISTLDKHDVELDLRVIQSLSSCVLFGGNQKKNKQTPLFILMGDEDVHQAFIMGAEI